MNLAQPGHLPFVALFSEPPRGEPGQEESQECVTSLLWPLGVDLVLGLRADQAAVKPQADLVFGTVCSQALLAGFVVLAAQTIVLLRVLLALLL